MVMTSPAPAADPPTAPGRVVIGDVAYLPLKDWCAREGVTPSNARGYYRERIPFKTIDYRHFVPEQFNLPRQQRSGRARKKAG